VATETQDDGFREIQLNGKQLVFVFMAATVVSVVIFLCGVLVGRGVRSERDTTQAAAQVEPIAPDLTAAQVPPTSKEEVADLTKAPPPSPPQGDAERGGAELVKPASESKPAPAAAAPEKAPVAKPDPVPASKAEVAPAPKAEAPRTAAAAAPAKAAAVPEKSPAGKGSAAAEAGPTSADARPAGAGIPAVDDPRRGWVIQVAAVKTRDEAEGLAKELGSKGYSAFILSGSSNVFRVRVGGYKSKRDAETVAAKLRREERINPWVTR
jgi:cell division septation protein DedD